MKITKLLDKLNSITDAKRKAQIKKYDSLKKVLKALRAEKARLEVKLAKTSEEESRREIESRLKVIKVQRKKGLKLLEDIKQERKQKR